MKHQFSKRYIETFKRLKDRGKIGFCPFAVLGDPTPSKCLARIKKYIGARPDFLELGIPFSDPVADGPVIQAADERALKSGTTPKKTIAMIKKIRTMLSAAHHNIPIGILTYSNIVLQYGIEKFYRDLQAAGGDSVLIADIPLEEMAPFSKTAHKTDLHQIFLVSEYTDGMRLKKIEKYGSGFLYVVSVLGVTGARKTLNKNTMTLIRKLKKKTKLPLMVGFGISKPQHLAQLKKAGANGAIVGSALVKTPIKNLKTALGAFKSAR